MTFNSLDFLIFFPLVTFLYFALAHKYRAIFLLFASCIFYMFFIPIYILILAFTIVIDYISGICIENSPVKKKKLYLLLSIFANVGVLCLFKYYNFINENLGFLARALDLNYPKHVLALILPIGLSFHTFKAISYTIEVYRGNQKAEKNFIVYALYVMFYPQLVAGPIERPQRLIHQFYEKHSFDYRQAADGLKLMAWGMFKKVVIADRLAIMVNQVYGNLSDHTGLPLLIATVFFAFQIYCDFSGYSDISIGAAQTMGFQLVDNFNRPYFSKSVSEFWKRWHISLSTWFRDYLYIPLGGSRVNFLRWQFNLFFTFLVSGLWHGANWTFIIWGAINGFYLMFSIWTARIRGNLRALAGLDKMPGLHKYINVAITFCLISFAWIFFRAKNIGDALYVIKNMFNFQNLFNKTAFIESMHDIGLTKYGLAVAVVSVIFMEFIHAIQRHGRIRHMLLEKPALMRWGIYYAFIFGMLFFGVFNKSQFIYFQF